MPIELREQTVSLIYFITGTVCHINNLFLVQSFCLRGEVVSPTSTSCATAVNYTSFCDSDAALVAALEYTLFVLCSYSVQLDTLNIFMMFMIIFLSDDAIQAFSAHFHIKHYCCSTTHWVRLGTVDPDGANEYCQDKEHCDNIIMNTGHRLNNSISTIYNTTNYSLP